MMMYSTTCAKEQLVERRLTDSVPYSSVSVQQVDSSISPIFKHLLDRHAHEIEHKEKHIFFIHLLSLQTGESVAVIHTVSYIAGNVCMVIIKVPFQGLISDFRLFTFRFEV